MRCLHLHIESPCDSYKCYTYGCVALAFIYPFSWLSTTTSGVAVSKGDVPKWRTFLGKVPNKIKYDLPSLVAFLKKELVYI